MGWVYLIITTDIDIRVGSIKNIEIQKDATLNFIMEAMHNIITDAMRNIV